jgi:hypothetical protein
MLTIVASRNDMKTATAVTRRICQGRDMGELLVKLDRTR